MGSFRAHNSGVPRQVVWQSHLRRRPIYPALIAADVVASKNSWLLAERARRLCPHFVQTIHSVQFLLFVCQHYSTSETGTLHSVKDAHSPLAKYVHIGHTSMLEPLSPCAYCKHRRVQCKRYSETSGSSVFGISWYSRRNSESNSVRGSLIVLISTFSPYFFGSNWPARFSEVCTIN